MSNTDLHLDLTGTVPHTGEPYNMSAGLDLAAPDLLDPAYPFVLYAINGQSGAQTLPILTLPPGTPPSKWT